MVATHSCRICHESSSKTYIAKEMMYGTRDEFEYFECENCGCLQISEIPTNLGDYYPSNYYSFKRLDYRFSHVLPININ